MATQVWLITDATRRIHPQTAKTEPVYRNQFATAGRKPEAVRKVPPVLAAMLPIIAVVFIAFLVIGLTLPVLPLHVHQGLGLGTFVVRLVAGAQFGASLLSRFCLSRFGAGARQPCAGFDRAGQLGRGLPRQHLVVLCAATIAVWLLNAPSLAMASRSLESLKSKIDCK